MTEGVGWEHLPGNLKNETLKNAFSNIENGFDITVVVSWPVLSQLDPPQSGIYCRCIYQHE